MSANGQSFEYSAYEALKDVNHIVAGVYIWEFLSTLDYEYYIVTGKRKLTLTFPLYLGCRWFALLSVLIQLRVPPGLECQTFVIIIFASAYLAFLCASALILLRVYALWERNKVIITCTAAIWLANAISYIYTTATTHGYTFNTICVVENTLHLRISIFSTFITDLAFLVLMLVGVLRWKKAGWNSGIWSLLYTQGLTWVVVFTLAEVPPLILITLNLNDSTNLIALVPGLVVTTIGASRIYRGLFDGTSTLFCSPPIIDVQERSSQAQFRMRLPSPLHPGYLAEGAGDAAGEVLISDDLRRREDIA
ncbi:hypothetical protein F5148DRAFT_727060 [Russula earlei]|uniref:Uncharacterized protein n=1 Tax=Russula earlei TaxID=71964 RepID=A0ACC0TUK9_9AGAM|nr:hypothetical protein F5148DRAFT_727060 [Russula earlei]